MAAEMNLHKGLYRQAELGWIKPSNIAGDITGGVELVLPAPGLTGRGGLQVDLMSIGRLFEAPPTNAYQYRQDNT